MKNCLNMNSLKPKLEITNHTNSYLIVFIFSVLGQEIVVQERGLSAAVPGRGGLVQIPEKSKFIKSSRQILFTCR